LRICTDYYQKLVNDDTYEDGGTNGRFWRTLRLAFVMHTVERGPVLSPNLNGKRYVLEAAVLTIGLRISPSEDCRDQRPHGSWEVGSDVPVITGAQEMRTV
jgi:hypothetical protein